MDAEKQYALVALVTLVLSLATGMVLCCCHAAARADDRMEQTINNERKDKNE